MALYPRRWHSTPLNSEASLGYFMHYAVVYVDADSLLLNWNASSWAIDCADLYYSYLERSEKKFSSLFSVFTSKVLTFSRKEKWLEIACKLNFNAETM
jgi:hypothetical protein